MPRPQRKSRTPSKYDDFEIKTSSSKKEQKNKFKTTNDKKHKSSTTSHLFFSPSKKSRIIFKRDDAPVQEKLLQGLGIDNMGIEDYIPSSLDQPDLVAVKSVNLLKKHGGRGLFAAKRIPRGTCIGSYTGISFAFQKEFDRYFQQNPKADNSYTMRVGKKFVDGAKKGNFTRFINFSDSQDNAEFVETIHKKTLIAQVMTTKDISVHSQILIDYNQYNIHNSKDYFFLNPEDGPYSASELHTMYAKDYTLMKMSIDIDVLTFKKDDYLFATSVGKAILENKRLSELEDMPDLATIDLPYLKTKELKTILDFDEADVFTPLMMACYAGQLENIQWLLKCKVNINRQQNHSGNCPLFFALAGYVQAESSEKTAYLKIVQLLIKNKANVFIHDRADMTFIHKASSILSTKDFKTIMTLLAKQDHIVFADLYSYIDENDFDIVLFCLKNKLFDKAKILIDLNPDYFDKGFNGKNKQHNLSFFEEFKMAIKDYDEEEKESLFNLLSNKKYKVSSKLLDELDFAEQEGNLIVNRYF